MKFKDFRIGQIVVEESRHTYGLVIGLDNEKCSNLLKQRNLDDAFVYVIHIGTFHSLTNVLDSNSQSFLTFLKNVIEDMLSQSIAEKTRFHCIPLLSLNSLPIEPYTEETKNWILKNRILSEEVNTRLRNLLSEAETNKLIDIENDIQIYLGKIEKNLKTLSLYDNRALTKGDILITKEKEENILSVYVYAGENFFRQFILSMSNPDVNMFVLTDFNRFIYEPVSEIKEKEVYWLDVNIFDCEINKDRL